MCSSEKASSRNRSGRSLILSALVVLVLTGSGRGQPAPPTVEYLLSCQGQPGEMVSPSRVFFTNSAEVLVSDPRTGSIVVLDLAGNVVAIHPTGGEPTGIVRDSAGITYVTDTDALHVRRFSEDWTELSPIGAGDFLNPNDIALAQGGGRLYVTDSAADLVRVYLTDGTPLFTFGGTGNSDGQFRFPTGVCVDSRNDEILVADHNNGRVQIFDSEGDFVAKFGRSGGGWGRFSRILGVETDLEGRVYVVDSFQACVHVITREGVWLDMIGEFGSEPGQFITPVDTVIDSNGWMWITSFNTSRVEVFTVEGLDVLEWAIY